MSLTPASPAPTHLAQGTSGSTIDLAKLYATHHVIIYFYPKDFTPGCTQEALGFKTAYPQIKQCGGEVIGVSKDSLQSHQKFATTHQLPFELIADESTELCQKFGVWQEKKMFKRVYMGIVRYTFLIKKGGIIHRSWAKVRVKNHVNQVCEELATLHST